MLNEFKKFALKGNMLDMAVGIIIGAAFGTIVSSLVDDVLMPIISGIFKLPDFSNLFVIINQQAEGVNYTAVEVAREAGEAVFAYGLFINAIIAFLLVAIALFFVVRTMNKLKKQEEEKVPAGPTELDVLKEIRDNLKR